MLPLYQLSFDCINGDVCRHIEQGRGGSEDSASWLNELYHEFGISIDSIGHREMHVADLVGSEIPFCFAIWASRRECASLWQPFYGDDAARGHCLRSIQRQRGKVHSHRLRPLT